MESSAGLMSAQDNADGAGYRQCCGSKLCNETTCPGICFKAKNVDVETPGKVFCATAVLEGLAMVTYGAVLIAREQEAEGSNGVLEASYLMGMAVFLTTAFVYFALDAVVGENKFQLYSAVTVSILTSGFVLVKYLNRDQTTLGTFWVDSRVFFLAIKGGFSLVSVVLTPFVIDSFGYRAFRVVGTDGDMIRRYSQYLQMWTMLRLDFVVNLVMIASYGFLYADVTRLRSNKLSTILSTTAAVVGVLQVVVGWTAATRESRGLFAMFVVFAAAQPAYIVYRLFFCFLQEGCEARPQQVTNVFFIAAAAAAITVKLLLLISSALAACNFGQGLKETVFDRHRS